MNINILSWYLLKGKPKKLWTFPKLKLWFQNNNFGPKKHQNYLKKSMDIHVWPTYLLKICPNFFPEKNMASTDPTYLWFGICPKFRSFFFWRPSLLVRIPKIMAALETLLEGSTAAFSEACDNSVESSISSKKQSAKI